MCINCMIQTRLTTAKEKTKKKKTSIASQLKFHQNFNIKEEK